MSLSSFFQRLLARSPASGRPVLPLDIPDVEPSRSTVIALQAVLAGYGIAVDADRLEAECGVVDDTACIDDIEAVAIKYGIPATQRIAPPEHVLLSPERLPAIVVETMDDGRLGFLLLWRIEDGAVQVLRADGARWEACREVQATFHAAEVDMPALSVEAYVKSAGFLPLVAKRLANLGMGDEAVARIAEEARREGSWRGMAALDAAARHIATKGVANVDAAVRGAFEAALRAEGAPGRIPREAFFVVGAPRGVQGEERVVMRGAVVVEMSPTAKG